MGPAYFVMAILGCGDAGSACQQVRIVPTHYSSAAACAAATQVALTANSDVDYPMVMSECRAAAGPQTAAREELHRGS